MKLAIGNDHVAVEMKNEIMAYLVEKGSSLSFVAEAKPPTVTMPRIKVNNLA